MTDSRFRIASAIAAIEAVHELPHGCAKDELVAVAKRLGMPEDLVTESLATAFFTFGQDGLELEKYAEMAVSLLDHEFAHRIYSA